MLLGPFALAGLIHVESIQLLAELSDPAPLFDGLRPICASSCASAEHRRPWQRSVWSSLYFGICRCRVLDSIPHGHRRGADRHERGHHRARFLDLGCLQEPESQTSSRRRDRRHHRSDYPDRGRGLASGGNESPGYRTTAVAFGFLFVTLLVGSLAVALVERYRAKSGPRSGRSSPSCSPSASRGWPTRPARQSSSAHRGRYRWAAQSARNRARVTAPETSSRSLRLGGAAVDVRVFNPSFRQTGRLIGGLLIRGGLANRGRVRRPWLREIGGSLAWR